MDFGDPQAPEPFEDDLALRTRCGYAVADAVRSFKVALEESGASAAGKCLHYTADLICSGCFELWQKILFEYAIDHVGLASPRIFWFLAKRFKDLQVAWAKLPAEQFYRTTDYQNTIAEVLLVLRSCPRRPAFKMPKVPPESHNEEWVRGTTMTAPSSAPVGRVFRGSHDLAILRRIGDDFAKACVDGATERAFFWVKWCMEEDSRMRRDAIGSLSTLDRGPSNLSGKQRSHVGFYFAALIAEIYKDLAPKVGLRMQEEFQALLSLYCIPDKKLTAKRRLDILCLAIQIICEVPRWKVPAAPALVQDPVALKRAIGHAEHFFREVLQYDPPTGDIAKEAKKGGNRSTNPTAPKLNAKQMKEKAIQDQLSQYDAIMNQFYGI